MCAHSTVAEAAGTVAYGDMACGAMDILGTNVLVAKAISKQF